MPKKVIIKSYLFLGKLHLTFRLTLFIAEVLNTVKHHCSSFKIPIIVNLMAFFSCKV